MYPQEITITPELAAHWLKFNTDNRKLPLSNLKHYIRLVEQGLFVSTHQALAFTGTPEKPMRLLDGQTRLNAIVATGTPVKQWVFWNAPQKTFQVIDGGKPRSFVDHHPEFDKNKIAVINVIWSFYTPGWTKKIMKIEADRIWKHFGPIFDLLYKETTGTRAGITPACVRAAFCYRILVEPYNAMNLISYYKSLVSGDLQGVPAAVSRLYSRLIPIKGGGTEVARLKFAMTDLSLASSNLLLSRTPKVDINYYSSVSEKIRSMID